jgi:two-component system phosphate regulon sensor histidine kinase PhoR
MNLSSSIFRKLLLAVIALVAILAIAVNHYLIDFVAASEPPDAGALTSALRERLAWVSIGFLAAALALSYLLSRRFSRRLDRLQQFAERMSDRRPAEPLRVDVLDEVGALGISLNRVSAQLYRSMEALEAEANNRDTILSGMVEGVLAVAPDMRVTFCNPSFARAAETDYPISGQPPLLSLVRDPELVEVVTRVIASRQPVRQRMTLAGRGMRTFMVHAAPSGDAANPGALAIFHDVTELERLERVRRDFVTNVSHELRTPLAAIQGYAETLLESAEEGTNRRFLETILENAIRLNNIASDLLALSELESGAYNPLDEVSVAAAVQNVMRAVAPEAGSREVTLVYDRVEDAIVIGSQLRLEQVLINLVFNAIKFNRPHGRVEVSVRNLPEGKVEIRVADTGIGIPSGDLPRIFERFYRVDKARSRDVGGTGLGLSIVKHAVETMRGGVRAESELGSGSVFTIVLPISQGRGV